MKNEAKRVVRILLIFILIVNMLLSISFATEQPSTTEITETTNSEEATSETENVEKSEKVVEENKTLYVKAKVIEAGETTKKTVGDIEDTVQSVKIEILDGEYESKEFTTDFILSYDIEGKILAYELKKGDTVTVQLSVDAN